MPVTLESIDEKLNLILGMLGGEAPQSSGPQLPKHLKAWDQYVEKKAKPFIKLTGELEGVDSNLKDAVPTLNEAFDKVRQVIVVASKSKKPKTKQFKVVLGPLFKTINDIDELRSKSRGTKSWDHFSALNEAMKALQWPGMRDGLINYVKETINSAGFYLIKVQRNYREDKHKEWIKEMKNMVNGMTEYLKEHGETGLRWNGKDGGDAVAVSESVFAGNDPYAQDGSAAPAPNAGGLAPPSGGLAPPSGGLAPPSGGLAPPGGLAAPGGGLSAPGKVVQQEKKSTMADVFAEIRSAKTSTLRHVTKDMKTKNRPKEEKQSKVPPKVPSKKSRNATKPKKDTRSGEPVFAVDDGDKKWIISYQKDDEDLEIDEDGIKPHHGVYVFRCDNSVLRIPKKVNALVIDDCKNLSVIFESTVASCELVNCHSCKVQAKGTVPMVQIDKSSGIQVFLSPQSARAPIVTANCSEINLCVINDEDYDEIPIPETFVHKFDPNTKTLTLEAQVV